MNDQAPPSPESPPAPSPTLPPSLPLPSNSTPPPADGPSRFKPGFNLELDARSMETLKWSAAWNTVAAGINILAGYVAGFFLGGIVGQVQITFGTAFRNFPIGGIIKELFWAAIYGAVIGVLISKFYPHIKRWNIKYLKGRLNTFFKLLFYPAVVINILAFLVTGFVTFAVGIVFHMIVFAGFIFGSYVYAKMMNRKVGHLFEPPT